MKILRRCLFLILLLLGSSGPVNARAGLVTLFQVDPVQQSFDFTDNHAGNIMKDHRVLADGGEIDFGQYHADSFSVAVCNGSTGRIVDLGTSKMLEEEYHYNETVGAGQGFASIHRKGTSFLIRQRHGTDDGSEYQELTEGAQLLTDLRLLDSTPVILGHIYLLHVIKIQGPPADTFVKLMVVAYQPGQSVTIRWEIMAPE